MPHFTWDVSLGTLVALAVMIGALYKFHMANVKRFLTIEFQVGQMWGVFKRRFNIKEDTFFNEDHE